MDKNCQVWLFIYHPYTAQKLNISLNNGQSPSYLLIRRESNIMPISAHLPIHIGFYRLGTQALVIWAPAVFRWWVVVSTRNFLLFNPFLPFWLKKGVVSSSKFASQKLQDISKWRNFLSLLLSGLFGRQIGWRSDKTMQSHSRGQLVCTV